MAQRPLLEREVELQLPSNLPVDWNNDLYISSDGEDVNLGEEYGYNYLNAQVNNAQNAIKKINESFDTLTSNTDGFAATGTTSGSSQAFTLSYAGSVTNGTALRVFFHTAPDNNATINVGSLGAKPIKFANGVSINGTSVLANYPVVIIWSALLQIWVIQYAPGIQAYLSSNDTTVQTLSVANPGNIYYTVVGM